MNLASVLFANDFDFCSIEHQTIKSRILHALFLFQEPRGIVTCKLLWYQKATTNSTIIIIPTFY
jgi:hypothetical protein